MNINKEKPKHFIFSRVNIDLFKVCTFPCLLIMAPHSRNVFINYKNLKGSFTLSDGNGNGKFIFRRECSYWGWGGVCQRQWQQQRHPNTYVIDFAVAVAIAAAKWVPNPFHDDAVAIAVDAPSSVNTPIGFHTTHS